MVCNLHIAPNSKNLFEILLCVLQNNKFNFNDIFIDISIWHFIRAI